MSRILTENFSKILLVLGILFLLASSVLFLWKENSLTFSDVINSEKVGHFGDFVGGLVGSLWALAGVVLFYIALRSQQEDFKTNRGVLQTQADALSYQVEEFKLQREEMIASRKLLNVQSETLKRQQFETLLFNMLHLQHSIVDSMDITVKQSGRRPRGYTLSIFRSDVKESEVEIYTGRDCFVHFSKLLKRFYDYRRRKISDERELIDKAYLDFYNVYQSDLGHYFRNLYHIFKLIHNSSIEDKRFYTSMVRAQLSNDELVLLFYNVISELGEKFLPLVVEYQILKNLDYSRLIDKKHEEFLPRSS